MDDFNQNKVQLRKKFSLVVVVATIHSGRIVIELVGRPAFAVALIQRHPAHTFGSAFAATSIAIGPERQLTVRRLLHLTRQRFALRCRCRRRAEAFKKQDGKHGAPLIPAMQTRTRLLTIHVIRRSVYGIICRLVLSRFFPFPFLFSLVSTFYIAFYILDRFSFAPTCRFLCGHCCGLPKLLPLAGKHRSSLPHSGPSSFYFIHFLSFLLFCPESPYSIYGMTSPGPISFSPEAARAI